MTSSKRAGPRRAAWYSPTAVAAYAANSASGHQAGQSGPPCGSGRVGPDPVDIAASLSPLRRAALLCAACLALVACGDVPHEVTGSPSTGLVFARMVGDGSDLARGRLSDGSVITLTQTPDRDETWPYWSELSRRLVFQVGPINARSQSDLQLWLPNTGEETPLTQTPLQSERWAAWSPTRRQLAFAFFGQRGSGVALYDLERGAAEILARDSEMYLRPTFSPDGSRVVAQRMGPGGAGSNLWLLNEGREPEALTTSSKWFDLKAWFTRDGRRIVFTRRPGDGKGWFEIDEIEVDSGEVHVIARSEESDSHSARPSPLRDEIAFVSDRAGNFDVYLAKSDGSEVRQLTRSRRDEFAPRWSPDGEYLVVTQSDHAFGLPRLQDLESLRSTRVVVLDRDGEAVFETNGFMPDWMPPW